MHRLGRGTSGLLLFARTRDARRKVAAAWRAGMVEKTYRALVVGDLDKTVHRMAVGTGAITRLPEMHDLGADVILATDDGNSWTRDGLWSLGMDVPVIFVAHGVSEIPGMMAMVEYLRGQFPDVPATHIAPEYPWTVVG